MFLNGVESLVTIAKYFEAMLNRLFIIVDFWSNVLSVSLLLA